MTYYYAWEPYSKWGTKKKFSKNSIIYSQGESSNGFYYLTEGRAKVKILLKTGDERIIDFMSPGEIFGSIKQEPNLSTIIAATDLVVYFFSNEVFKKIVSKHPEAAQIYMGSIFQKQRLLAESLIIQGCSIEQQMAYYIFKLSQTYNTPEIPINQSELALHIGISRITIYKILQKWKKKGIIEILNRSIRICNPSEIKKLVGIENGAFTYLSQFT